MVCSGRQHSRQDKVTDRLDWDHPSGSEYMTTANIPRTFRVEHDESAKDGEGGETGEHHSNLPRMDAVFAKYPWENIHGKISMGKYPWENIHGKISMDIFP